MVVFRLPTLRSLKKDSLLVRVLKATVSPVRTGATMDRIDAFWPLRPKVTTGAGSRSTPSPGHDAIAI